MFIRTLTSVALTVVCVYCGIGSPLIAGESYYQSSRRYHYDRPTYAQKYRLNDYDRRSSYPLSTGKRNYGYNPRDYMKPIARIDRTRRPLGYPYRSPYPYYYPYSFYYGFYPYSYYNFYRIPWYTNYNYGYYHDLYRPNYSTPNNYSYGY
ncbi:hypothetical protein Pla110_26810 [Polystyrenella longa]|uniref:Uncharacterized protein n=1 Tax=Polystyrenella longa TaxID=2528007 RepID=A0A518CNZ1_9PLAN|nr:hypothetical protein [Polystyrenella longa]QDU80945.1 hypothetical protein Pla110_26810 [Polystyrenella longa]